eukprot:5120943-Pleurochrysis_carterae.AAC.1
MFQKLIAESWPQLTRSSDGLLLSSTQRATPERSTSSNTLPIAGDLSHRCTWTLLMPHCGFFPCDVLDLQRRHEAT